MMLDTDEMMVGFVVFPMTITARGIRVSYLIVSFIKAVTYVDATISGIRSDASLNNRYRITRSASVAAVLSIVVT
jgi:hypothetical protein